MRYAAATAMLLGLAACGGAQDQLAWLEDIQDRPAGEAPCYDIVELPVANDSERAAEAGGRGDISNRNGIASGQQEIRIETPCPDEMTNVLVASLQRALAARGHYAGRATGVMDDATRAAVKSYQTEQGLPSASLSVETARELGLIAYPREEIPTEG